MPAIRLPALATALITIGAILVVGQENNSSSRARNIDGYTPTALARLRQKITVQNWDDGGEISHFVYLHSSELFPTAVISRRGPTSALAEAPNPAVGTYVVSNENGRKVTLAEYVARGHGVDGFIVLHHGRVVYEAYPRMRPEDKHLLMSITKAFVGTVVGILEDRGKIDIHRQVSDYIPALKGTGWEAATVRDLLEMASGMEGVESGAKEEPYSNPLHKHYQSEASLGWQPKTPQMPESVLEENTYKYLSGLKRIRKPGETWAYTSVNTQVLAWLLEEVTGKSLAEVVSDEIWVPMEAESDALIAVNSKGVAVAHGGMSSTLRDVARFGLLFTPSWQAATHKRVVSEAFFRRITQGGRVELVKDWLFGPRPEWLDHVAYQWDAITKAGRFFKGGFGGQLLYVDPRNDVVIAKFGTNANLEDNEPPLPLGTMVDDLFGGK